MIGNLGFSAAYEKQRKALVADATRAVRGACNALPERCKWAPHNLIAHPVSEVIYLLTGREAFGNWLHDATVPAHKKGEGRG
jgi:hypothetical protein